MKPTPDQQAIIDADAPLLKVNAVAGSGKTTTTLRRIASRPHEKALYLVFNKSAQTDAERRAKKMGITHCDIMTTHGLAYRHIMPKYQYQLANEGLSPADIIQHLKLSANRDSYAIASLGGKLLELFCNSAATDFSGVSFGNDLNPASLQFTMDHLDEVCYVAGKMWDMMKNGQMPITHSFYTKLFQLERPTIRGYKTIYIDEFQDTNPVFLDVFNQQDTKKFCMGDDSQAIYGFRGAVNALKLMDFPEMTLQTSFRFGERVADEANRILDLRRIVDPDHTPRRVIGAARHAVDINPGATTFIGRTNGVLLDTAFQIMDVVPTMVPFFEGGFTNYLFSNGTGLWDVFHTIITKNLSKVKNPVIRDLGNLRMMTKFAEETHDINLRSLIGIVQNHGPSLPDKYFKLKARSTNQGPGHRKAATHFFTTAHRAKGLEYPNVIVVEGFTTEKKLREELKGGIIRPSVAIEEINLLYVAVTRAEKQLQNLSIDLVDRSE